MIYRKSFWRRYNRAMRSAFYLLSGIWWLPVAYAGETTTGETVTGQFIVNTLSSDCSIYARRSSTNDFRFSMDLKGRWMCELRPMNDEGSIIYSSFDGTNTFWVYYPKVAGPWLLTAYISSGNFPYAPFDLGQDRAQVLWLFFGSGQCLRDSKTQTIPLPWRSPRTNLGCYGYRDEAKLSSSPPYVPVALKFVRSTNLDLTEDRELDRDELDLPSRDSGIADLRNDLRERKNEWPDGFVTGKLSTVGFTNRNGLTFPLNFEFDSFLPDFYVGYGSNHPSMRYKGTVTAVDDLSSQQTFQPPVLARLLVSDSRFRIHNSSIVVNYIDYFLKEGQQWPTVDDPKYKAIFHEEMLSSPRFKVSRSSVGNSLTTGM